MMREAVYQDGMTENMAVKSRTEGFKQLGRGLGKLSLPVLGTVFSLGLFPYFEIDLACLERRKKGDGIPASLLSGFGTGVRNFVYQIGAKGAVSDVREGVRILLRH